MEGSATAPPLSSSTTSILEPAKVEAIVRPAGPAPMMQTSVLIVSSGAIVFASNCMHLP